MLQIVIRQLAVHSMFLQKRKDRFRIDPHIHQELHAQLCLPRAVLPAAILCKPFVKISDHKVGILLLRINILLRIHTTLLDLRHHFFPAVPSVTLVPSQLPITPQRLIRIQIDLHVQNLPHLRQIQRMQTAHDDIRLRRQLSLRSKSTRDMIVIRSFYRIVATQHPQILRLPVQIIGPRI